MIFYVVFMITYTVDIRFRRLKQRLLSFQTKIKMLRNLLFAVTTEVVAEKVTDSFEKKVREDFHEFLRAHTNILIKNVYYT